MERWRDKKKNFQQPTSPIQIPDWVNFTAHLLQKLAMLGSRNVSRLKRDPGKEIFHLFQSVAQIHALANIHGCRRMYVWVRGCVCVYEGGGSNRNLGVLQLSQ